MQIFSRITITILIKRLWARPLLVNHYYFEGEFNIIINFIYVYCKKKYISVYTEGLIIRPASIEICNSALLFVI